jgi:asparagine synthase (glutamine-hydrolysing)
MCGISGIFDTTGRREIDRELLARMNDRLQHRGPDDAGYHVGAGIGLAHRRLSIIDLATGHQPLYNENGRICVIFNGEMYNYQALIAELSGLGHVFATRSDTEVIVHAWEQWGEDCVTRFRGMFALALWDEDRQCLFLARDRLGVKPLYFARLRDGTFVFGSELKALLVHPLCPREIDPLAVEDYFALGYVPEPRAIYAGVEKLPPAHTLLVRRGELSRAPKRYWDVAFTGDSRLSEDDARVELVERLEESIRLRMIADVPLGAFLSGGVDSSAVVAMMATVSRDPVKTCSIAFDDPAYDESMHARSVAARYHTTHHVERVESDDFALVDTLAATYDEPYADSSAIPTYRVCELARKHVTVALSGDGGDENFAGYRRYRLHAMEEGFRTRLPLAFRSGVFGPLARAYPKLDWAPRIFRAKTTFEAMARDSVDAYFNSVSLLRDPMRARLFTPAFRNRLSGYNAIEIFRRHAASSQTDDPVGLVQYLDLKTYLVGDINTKVDRASMAHALEVREPLMDHPLVEWLATLPTSMKICGTEGKVLLKRAMGPYLPAEVMYRPKMGFSVPVARWFRGPLRGRVRDALLGEQLADTGWFDTNYLRQMVEAHETGGRDYSTPIWSLLMFEAFLRNGGAQRAEPPDAHLLQVA